MSDRVMLANEHGKHSAKWRKRYPTLDSLRQTHVFQPKYDGVFCMIADGAQAYTRTGEELLSVEHITERYGRPGYVVFGELWTEGLDFATISGLARRHEPSPQLGFIPFDMVSELDYVSGYTATPYASRVVEMYDRGLYVPTEVHPADDESLTQLAQCYVDIGGYDGLIGRDIQGRWFKGRSKDGEIVKIKPNIRLSLRVTGVTVTPRDTKLGGYLTVAMPVSGAPCDVGSGLTQAILAQAAGAPDAIIGRIAEVEAMGYTNGGLLREPRFKGWRHDLTVADGE